MIMIPVMHSQFRKIPAIKLPTTMRTHMGKQLQRLLSIPAIPLFPGMPGRRNDFIQFIICRLNHRHLVIPTQAGIQTRTQSACNHSTATRTDSNAVRLLGFPPARE